MSEPAEPQSSSPPTTTTDKLNSSSHSTSNSTTNNKRSSLKKRRSSLFAAARASFYRTRGQSGASVETLRGNTGADFEGYATVHRGGAEDTLLDYFDITNLFKCLFCSSGNKDGVYFLLIKGFHCFVFKDEEAKSPVYAIELMNRRAAVQPSHASFVPRVPHPGASQEDSYTTVHLETSLGDVEYKFTFVNEDGKNERATRFCGAVAAASNEASTEQVRKRLGHAGLLNKRSSVRYANQIGKAKAKEQPEAPLTSGEVLAGMPAAETYA